MTIILASMISDECCSRWDEGFLKYREELRTSGECCNQSGKDCSKPREKLRISDECCDSEKIRI
jgi:hypothetical protein